MDLLFREPVRDEIRDVHKLELESFPEDEADSYERIVYVHSEAPELLLGCYHRQRLIGFICATRCHGKHVTQESINMHFPNGESVYLHTVAVCKDFRRRGVAMKLLEEFIQKVKTNQKNVSRILLISKSHLIPLYTRVGFRLQGKSEVVLGKDPWYELQMNMTGYLI